MTLFVTRASLLLYLCITQLKGGFTSEDLYHHLQLLFLGVDLLDNTCESTEWTKSNTYTLTNYKTDFWLHTLLLHLINRT